jgi:hypothetical protein
MSPLRTAAPLITLDNTRHRTNGHKPPRQPVAQVPGTNAWTVALPELETA